MPSKVLLVEDDAIIARIIRHYLSGEEFEVTWCSSAEAVDELPDLFFDVALLDIMLPGANGYDVCARLCARHDCPIIFVSCLDDSDSIVKALEMGGDDFITKPFDARVLIAKIRANVRRAGSFHREGHLEDQYVFPGLTIDVSTRVVHGERGASELTPLEFQMLMFLVRNASSFYRTEELYYNVWGKNSYGDTRTVMVLMHSIRAKIEPDPASPRYLVNRRGRGYAFMPGVD